MVWPRERNFKASVLLSLRGRMMTHCTCWSEMA